MLLEILAITGIDVKNAIMVGDSSYDLEMAQNIHMPAIGVSYGVHRAEQLSAFNPLAIVDDVASLHQLLLRQLKLKRAV